MEVKDFLNAKKKRDKLSEKFQKESSKFTDIIDSWEKSFEENISEIIDKLGLMKGNEETVFNYSHNDGKDILIEIGEYPCSIMDFYPKKCFIIPYDKADKVDNSNFLEYAAECEED